MLIMNEGLERAKRAREILEACEIEVGADFQALSTSQIAALQVYADQHRLKKYGPTAKHRRPPNGNSSLLLYFHDLLQRRATVRITEGRSRRAAQKG
jgi:hypothetical protein